MQLELKKSIGFKINLTTNILNNSFNQILTNTI
jgi:hypothetical protein